MTWLSNSRGRVMEQVADKKPSFLHRILNFKAGMDLPYPGTFENLHREARMVSLTNFLFEGGKADLAKGLSPNFQVSHSYSMGTPNSPPSYHFGAVYADAKHFAQGNIDNSGNLQGKYTYNLTKNLTGKVQTQISQQPQEDMTQVEAEYAGKDYSLNGKIINLGVTDGTGIFTGSYLQSITKKLALGVEGVYQKPEPGYSDVGFSLVAKYSGPNYVATLNLQQLVALQLSYFHRVSEKVELATELQMLLVGPRKDAVATVAAKFDYRSATIRAQVDTTGKTGVVLEEKLIPGLSFLVSGEIDHVKSRSRFGVGLNMEN